jgi:hypothetical protein
MACDLQDPFDFAILFHPDPYKPKQIATAPPGDGEKN